MAGATPDVPRGDRRRGGVQPRTEHRRAARVAARADLPPGALEVVLVDDGSDGRHRASGWSPRRAAHLPASCAHPELRLARAPAQRRPGHGPRGEFVFFADHDDEFFPESLSRWCPWPGENDADIVVGKVVRTLGGPPRTGRWRTVTCRSPTRPATCCPPAPCTSSTGGRPAARPGAPGSRRAGCGWRTTSVFTAQVLPHARVVSVLASYPCYRWIHRPDGTNSSDMVVEPDVYWGSTPGSCGRSSARRGRDAWSTRRAATRPCSASPGSRCETFRR